ncbi:hypothetical protein [Flavobacterium sp.]|uniref:hypothetical protein n=1 Tax=Flavobacterium sp. TaxID=239 RepID=UPI004048747C
MYVLLPARPGFTFLLIFFIFSFVDSFIVSAVSQILCFSKKTKAERTAYFASFTLSGLASKSIYSFGKIDFRVIEASL